MTYSERQREAARQLARQAEKDGRLVAPSGCEHCGTEGRLHKHHCDYGQPLRVTWLCPRCHKKIHADERAAWGEYKMREMGLVAWPEPTEPAKSASFDENMTETVVVAMTPSELSDLELVSRALGETVSHILRDDTVANIVRRARAIREAA